MRNACMDYYKGLNEARKEMKDIVSKFMCECYNELLENVDSTFSWQLNEYTIGIYELDELINSHKTDYDPSLTERINKLIIEIKECEKTIKLKLKEMDELFSIDPLLVYKREIKNKMEKTLISKYNNKYIKNLLRTCVKEEILNLQKTLKLYYDEQKDNVKRYYNVFEFQNEIIRSYESFMDRKERLENMEVKRFTCTYNQMATFLESKGYKKIRQKSTSHAIYKNQNGHSLPLPNKRGEMCMTTISLILNQCNSNRNELGKFIKKAI